MSDIQEDYEEINALSPEFQRELKKVCLQHGRDLFHYDESSG